MLSYCCTYACFFEFSSWDQGEIKFCEKIKNKKMIKIFMKKVSVHTLYTVWQKGPKWTKI